MSEPYQPPSPQPESGQPYPQSGQPYPQSGQPYPQSGQPQQGYQQGQPPHYPGQQYPGQQYPGQQYPGQQQYPPPQGYPQQAQPGQYPGSGFPGQGQPAAKTAIPTTVTAAFAVYLVAAVLSLVGMILALNSDIWDQAVREAGVSRQDLGGVSVESVVAIAKGFVIAVGVIFLGLYLLFAFKMRAGRNWARITLTVLSALSLLSTANASASVTVNDRTYTSTSSATTGWISAVLSIAAIVLMFLPASNEYFRTVKAQRMQQKLQQYQG